MNHYKTARDVIRKIRQGCGDSACMFNKPTGMATNGGCRCHQHIEEALAHVEKSMSPDGKTEGERAYDAIFKKGT